MEAAYANPIVKDEIDRISKIIKSLQLEGLANRILGVNKVVHDDVVKFFKNEMQYTTNDSKTGQPVNMTLFIDVSW